MLEKSDNCTEKDNKVFDHEISDSFIDCMVRLALYGGKVSTFSFIDEVEKLPFDPEKNVDKLYNELEEYYGGGYNENIISLLDMWCKAYYCPNLDTVKDFIKTIPSEREKMYILRYYNQFGEPGDYKLKPVFHYHNQNSLRLCYLYYNECCSYGVNPKIDRDIAYGVNLNHPAVMQRVSYVLFYYLWKCCTDEKNKGIIPDYLMSIHNILTKECGDVYYYLPFVQL